MTDFIDAIALSALPPGAGTEVTLAGKEVALFEPWMETSNVDACPHADA